MSKSDYSIVIDFGDADVRKKSLENVPSIFREWELIKYPQDDGQIFRKRDKKRKLSRRLNTLGHPSFDIYSDWIMAFSAISAFILKSTDWERFRKLLLIHVPECDFNCWYCLKTEAYSLAINKQITAWLDIRNNAAHGNYDQYTIEEAKIMIDGIENFIISNPA